LFFVCLPKGIIWVEQNNNNFSAIPDERDLVVINGHATGTDLLEVPYISYKAYATEYPHKI
jgi:hypothetical protein